VQNDGVAYTVTFTESLRAYVVVDLDIETLSERSCAVKRIVGLFFNASVA